MTRILAMVRRDTNALPPNAARLYRMAGIAVATNTLLLTLALFGFHASSDPLEAKRVHAVERPAFDRNADDRKRGMRGEHAGQVRGAAGGCNDDFQPAARRLRGVARRSPGGPMRRDDVDRAGHAEITEGVDSRFQQRPVRVAAHDNPHGGPGGFCLHDVSLRVTSRKLQVYIRYQT